VRFQFMVVRSSIGEWTAATTDRSDEDPMISS
jgi:hypothetical protein